VEQEDQYNSYNVLHKDVLSAADKESGLHEQDVFRVRQVTISSKGYIQDYQMIRHDTKTAFIREWMFIYHNLFYFITYFW
jgi:hypothetical protein